MAEVPPPEGQMNGGGATATNSSEPLGSKRQRRPSVRLGDIGDQPYDSHPRRTANVKSWRLHFDHHRKDASGKPSKTRPLTNLTSAAEFSETLEGEGNMDSVVIGSWKVKDSKKRGAKRGRSNWISRIDGEDKYSGGEDVDDEYHRNFDVENSESPLMEQSPVHSLENLGVDGNDREEHHYHDRNGNGGGRGEDGVRIWLNGLGLGRYAPVFEIHEVDDEVLPLLTLEDLKDMGINAVGSRRKMYCAIQKLGKGFS